MDYSGRYIIKVMIYSVHKLKGKELLWKKKE